MIFKKIMISKNFAFEFKKHKMEVKFLCDSNSFDISIVVLARIVSVALIIKYTSQMESQSVSKTKDFTNFFVELKTNLNELERTLEND